MNLNINPKAISSTAPYFSLQAAVLLSSKRIEFSDTFYEDTIVRIRKDSTDDKLSLDMVVSQSDLEDGQIVGEFEVRTD